MAGFLLAAQSQALPPWVDPVAPLRFSPAHPGLSQLGPAGQHPTPSSPEGRGVSGEGVPRSCGH